MAQQKIQRLAGDAKARVYLHLDGHHLGPDRHLCHVMTTQTQKQKVRHPHRCIYTLSFPKPNVCPASHVRWRLYSRFADSWWSIHRLVHYQLRGNAADSHCDDTGSHLSESNSEEESWLKGTGFLSIIIIYN